MSTVVVSEKPRGRVISFLPSNELRRVARKNEKTYASELLVNSTLNFKVEQNQYAPLYPYSFVVNGRTSSPDKRELDKGIYRDIKLNTLEFYVRPKFRQAINTEPLVTVVKLGQDVVDNTNSTSFEALTFEVEDTRPIQSIITNGGNVESMEYTMQQQSFYEIKVKFKDAEIVSVNNLPLGMILEKGVVKGCPIYSGTIVSEFLLNNGDTVNITFKVSQLPRTL